LSVNSRTPVTGEGSSQLRGEVPREVCHTPYRRATWKAPLESSSVVGIEAAHIACSGTPYTFCCAQHAVEMAFVYVAFCRQQRSRRRYALLLCRACAAAHAFAAYCPPPIEKRHACAAFALTALRLARKLAYTEWDARASVPRPMPAFNAAAACVASPPPRSPMR